MLALRFDEAGYTDPARHHKEEAVPVINTPYVDDLAYRISRKLSGGLKLKCWSTDRRYNLQLFDRHGPVELLTIGSKQEVARYLEGFEKALEILGR